MKLLEAFVIFIWLTLATVCSYTHDGKCSQISLIVDSSTDFNH
jgi:hypothetical protein